MKHQYEKTQQFNAITKFLHNTRYKNLYKFMDKIFIEDLTMQPIKVVDIGCGTAKTYSLLNANYNIDYLGIELREDFVKLAKERYAKNSNFNIICDSIENHYDKLEGSIVIGLETLEHIPEGIVVRVIEAIAEKNVEHFYCTVPNEIGPAIFIKNFGSFLMRYPRHKEYTWKETFSASLYDLDKVGIHHTAHKGFDWRWLAQTIRQNMKIDSITTSPFNIIPRSLSPSIGFICSKRIID